MFCAVPRPRVPGQMNRSNTGTMTSVMLLSANRFASHAARTTRSVVSGSVRWTCAGTAGGALQTPSWDLNDQRSRSTADLHFDRLESQRPSPTPTSTTALSLYPNQPFFCAGPVARDTHFLSFLGSTPGAQQIVVGYTRARTRRTRGMRERVRCMCTRTWTLGYPLFFSWCTRSGVYPKLFLCVPTRYLRVFACLPLCLRTCTSVP